MVHSLSQRLIARYFAGLLAISGLVSAAVHPLPNLTDMGSVERAAITLVCVAGGALIWVAPWDRWPRWSLLFLPVVGIGVKMWANLLGGLGPYSYAIHFALIYVWMGVALPRGVPLAFAPLLAVAYAVPLYYQGDPRHTASVAMVVPICVVIGESVAWISNRLRQVEQIDGLHMHRMGWLVEASVELAGARSREQAAGTIARLAADLPGAEGCAVLLPTGERRFEVVAVQGWPAPVPEPIALADEPALVEAIRERSTLGQDAPKAADLSHRLGVARLAVTPLFGSARCMGIVLLGRRPGAPPFDEFHRDLVQTLSVQAGLALERVKLTADLLDDSLRDELTGIGNRRKANVRLEALRPGDALVMIDLDHFKQVNDSRGHAAGDETLRELGAFLASSLRDGDEVFRMGGEEFLVVLAGAGGGAGIAAQRLCEGWRSLAPVTTFSAGVCLHGAAAEPAETLDRADGALYEAKHAGRDRIATAPESPGPG